MTIPASNHQDPWIGVVLGNRYRLVARIGAGGMGVVYRAWDMADNGYVVVKMPKRELIGDPEFLKRFEQELSALKILSHDSVVPIIDFGTENATPFAVMPYLAGGSLKQRIRLQQDGQPKPEDPSMLWHWLPAIAHALDDVHANGFVHRDVKPDNILFDGLGRPYLSDFGVAKLVLQEEDAALTRGLTRTGFALGTPDYMAPELVSGAATNAFVDQYALAVVVYELICGAKPFRGPTPAAVMIAHVTTQASPLADLQPSLPKTMSDAVVRGLEKNPSGRFSRCIEFAAGVLTDIPKPTAATKTKLMCPECARLLTVQHDWAGRKGNCPRCNTAITIGSDLLSLWIPSDQDQNATADSGMSPPEQFSAAPSESISINVDSAPRASFGRYRKSRPSSRVRSRLLTGLQSWLQVVFVLCGVGIGGWAAVRLLAPGRSLNVDLLRTIPERLTAKDSTQPIAAPSPAPRTQEPTSPAPHHAPSQEQVPIVPNQAPQRINIKPQVEPQVFPHMRLPSLDSMPSPPNPAQPAVTRARRKPPDGPTVQGMFFGRTDEETKNHFLQVYGGTEDTERAVSNGLQWLANHQLPDGSWTLNLVICPQCRGQCANGSDHKKGAPTAATSMALLCFLGSGHTHIKAGPYKETVKRAMDRLSLAAKIGRGQCYIAPEDMYSQGFAVLALAEACAMTRNRLLKDPLQAAVHYLIAAQDPQGGGWRYSPRQPGDTSASGWQIAALATAAIAGANVPGAVGRQASFFLDSVQDHGGLAYGYSSRGDAPATSAVGLYCRTLLGWESDSIAIQAGLDRLRPEADSRDLYFQYYAINLLRKNGGPLWDTWNAGIRDALLERQAQVGHQKGSWHEGFTSGHAPSTGGRLYCTAMAILILESYYRYAYPHDFEE